MGDSKQLTAVIGYDGELLNCIVIMVEYRQLKPRPPPPLIPAREGEDITEDVRDVNDSQSLSDLESVKMDILIHIPGP